MSKFLDNLADGIKHALVEEDETTKVAAKPVAAASPPPPPAAPIMGATAPYDFGALSGTPLSSTPVPSNAPIDDSIISAVNDGVFGGDPTSYVNFMKVSDAMGRPADPGVVLKVIQATNPAVTPVLILNDINGHLQRLDTVAAKATNDFDQAAQQRLGSADETLKNLQQQNDAAAAEIARHQSETSDRMAQIAQISQQRNQDRVAIEQAKANTEKAAAAVKQQLTSMQAMFTSLTAKS